MEMCGVHRKYGHEQVTILKYSIIFGEKNLRGRDHLADNGVNERRILQFVLKK
jgi:hypothetical protein